MKRLEEIKMNGKILDGFLRFVIVISILILTTVVVCIALGAVGVLPMNI